MVRAGDAPWEPLGIDDVTATFDEARFTWFVAGGHALELAVGHSWREHSDTDVGVRRDQLPQLYAHLAGSWELHVAAAGELRPWRGEGLSTDRHENNVWARSSPGGPWRFDITVGGGTDDVWQSRRDPSIAVPWSAALGRRGGVPFLAPHLQLLMKSKDVRPKDDLDARVVVPELDDGARRWLARHLPTGHPWLHLLA